jgi:hypothetical protein
MSAPGQFKKVASATPEDKSLLTLRAKFRRKVRQYFDTESVSTVADYLSSGRAIPGSGGGIDHVIVGLLRESVVLRCAQSCSIVDNATDVPRIGFAGSATYN